MTDQIKKLAEEYADAVCIDRMHEDWAIAQGSYIAGAAAFEKLLLEKGVDTKEIWKASRFNPNYQVSNLGNIRYCYSLKPVKDKQNYGYIKLWNNKKCVRVAIHKMIADAFLGERPQGLEIRHLDGNPENNSVDNLKYGTTSENAKDKIIHGTGPIGERSPTAKLNELKVHDIRKKASEGYMHSELAAEYGVAVSTIICIIERKTWKHV